MFDQIPIVGNRTRDEMQREPAQAEEPVVRHPLGLADETYLFDMLREQFEGKADLLSGECGTETEMGTLAEADMGIGVSADVEPERIIEHPLISVR